jgi:hypothetical protein
MPDWQKIIVPTGVQVLSQVEFMEVTNVEPIEKVINQSIIKG